LIYVQAAEILAKEGISAEVKNDHNILTTSSILVMDIFITIPITLGYKLAHNPAIR